jgi:hypothetical protein
MFLVEAELKKKWLDELPLVKIRVREVARLSKADDLQPHRASIRCGVTDSLSRLATNATAEPRRVRIHSFTTGC